MFSGDTLFQGGPGATGRSFSDFPTILESISGRLGTLPADTVVYTGHGDSTTVGDEIVHYDDWVARGHQARQLSRMRRFSAWYSSSVSAPESLSAASCLICSSRMPWSLGA